MLLIKTVMWLQSLFSIWFLIAACILVHRALGIEGGEDANILHFPYVVSIQDLRSYEQHICGGALIEPGIVLTAAHCVYDRPRSALQVYGGSVDLTVGGSVSLVSKVIVHPEFNWFHRYNDIAVVFLSTPFTYSMITRPIEFATPTKAFDRNRDAQVAGWGQTSAHSRYSQKLQYLNVTIIGNERCNSIFNRVLDSMICAGVLNRKSGTCTGDSGNPLVVEVNRQVWIEGIASYLFKGECADGLPTVYTRVASFAEWIRWVIRTN